MFDNFSNLIFIAVALAVFIGRTVVEAKRKKAPPPEKPKIPALHFEGDDEEVVQYFRSDEAPPPPPPPPPPKVVAKPKPKRTTPNLTKFAPIAPKEVFLPSTADKAAAAKVIAPPVVGQTGLDGLGRLNLSHLSPMKQAVVMAEILGQPKGMS